MRKHQTTHPAQPGSPVPSRRRARFSLSCAFVMALAITASGAVAQAETAEPAAEPGIEVVGVPPDTEQTLEPEVSQEIQYNQNAVLEGTSQALINAYLELSTAKAQLPKLEAALEEAIGHYNRARQRHTQLVDTLATTKRQLAQVSEQAEEATDTVAQSQRTRQAMARDAMVGHSAFDAGFAVVLGTDTVEGAIREQVARQTVSSSRLQVISRAQQEAGATRNTLDRLNAVEEEVTRLREEAAKALAEATAAKQSAERVQDELEALIDSLSSLTQAMEAEKAADQARQRYLEAEMQALQIELAAYYGQSDDLGPAITDGMFSGPLSQLRVTSPFGPRVHPVYNEVRMHTGVDFGAACGLPVFSIGPGIVVQTSSSDGYGNRVVVNHGSAGGAPLLSTYNHLETIGRQIGELVGKGEVVGTVGTTGVSTGCHLHFEIQKDGQLVDPLPFLVDLG